MRISFNYNYKSVLFNIVISFIADAEVNFSMQASFGDCKLDGEFTVKQMSIFDKLQFDYYRLTASKFLASYPATSVRWLAPLRMTVPQGRVAPQAFCCVPPWLPKFLGHVCALDG